MVKAVRETIASILQPSGLIALAAILTCAAPNAAHAASTIPRDLSVGAMFVQADWVVKLVMLGLLAASVVTWTIFIAKHRALRTDAAAQCAALTELQALRGLADADDTLAAHPMVAAARAELALSADALDDREGVKERVGSRLSRHEALCARRLSRGINILGTIGATAPFVGLFGTVWGIMNAFVGIAEQQTTNLAVVAPGIAEALLATAMGLVAAIPAVVIYNHFSRMVAANRAVIADSSATVMQIVSRDLSRGVVLTQPARQAA